MSENTNKIKARCYGVWGCPYYRTETGHTFSVIDTPGEKVVFYHGDVIHGPDTLKKLTEEEKAELFARVEFCH